MKRQPCFVGFSKVEGNHEDIWEAYDDQGDVVVYCGTTMPNQGYPPRVVRTLLVYYRT